MGKYKGSVSGILILASLLLSACVGSITPVDNRNSSLTQGNVQMSIIIGETTKADVLEAFGAPNVTTRDGSGRETWSYQRAATASQSSNAKANVQGMLPIIYDVSIGGSGFQQTSRMITLIIKFDSNDVVIDFKSRESNF